MVFRDDRRQRFIDEKHYTEFKEELKYGIESSKKILHEDELTPNAIRSFRWGNASESLELLILDYTAGVSLTELQKQLPPVIEEFDAYIPFDIPRPNEAHTLEITQLEAYVYVLWLLGLCKLLGHDALIPNVISWLDKNAEFNRGRDTILEQVIGKLTSDTQDPGRYALHPDAYRPLGKAILAEDPADRPALVKEFVESWYKNMKPCYWYGTHTDKESFSYFGYWCFEAALVTYLWDIDDSSYRDHLVYPKDLVNYARARSSQPSPLAAPERGRVEANQPCPRTGYWFTPAQQNSRRHFKEGEIMPIVRADYGVNIWQWDENQAE